MGTRTEYAPGTFCWIDLSTSDQEAAKAFYGELLGWVWDDLPVGDGATYSMAKLDDHDVAAVSSLQPGDPSPPHWNNYVWVEDAAAAAAKAAENGGTVLMDAFDVLDSGRMAVIQDPTGGVFCLWQPRDHGGAGLVNEVGAFSWNELATTDIDAAGAFYAATFGWDLESMDTGEAPAYTIVSVDGRSNGGLREQAPEESENVPPHWIPYIAVESCDSSAERAGGLGATVLFAPMDIPNGGRIAGLADPQGAAFAIWEGPLDD